MPGIALKCTYNDGGEGEYVGFHGTCSNDTIAWNIEQNRVWCNSSDCRSFYDREFTGKRPVNPCYESTLFSDWVYGAGWYQNGAKAGTPLRIRNVNVDDVVILTTRFPGDPEADRRIIGYYVVREIGDEQETFLYGSEDSGVRFPLEDAKKLRFWDYYSIPSGEIAWGSGLFRYLTDEQVAHILDDLSGFTNHSLVKHQVIGTAPASLRTHMPKILENVKYGPGGESEEHLKLKQWIASNPNFLDLKGITSVQVESHVFPSGDLPDIVLEHSGGIAVIEIETNTPRPGAFQAIKYRVLACAEQGLPLDTPSVQAFLIAWDIPPDVRGFCRRYGLMARAKRL